MPSNYVSLKHLLNLLLLIQIVKCDFYTSTAEMESLLKTEKELPTLLDLYIKSEQVRIEKIKELTKNISFSSVSDSKEAESFLSNPINIYHLIKRLTFQVNPLLKLINGNNTNALKEIAEKYNVSLNIPDENDFEGVALALNRLKVMYNLTVATFVKGEFTSKTKSMMHLTALDCFDIGIQQTQNELYNMSIPWLEEALKIEEREKIKTVNRLIVLEHLIYSYYKVLDFKKAIDAAEVFLKIDPGNEMMQSNLKYYRISIQLPQFIPEKKVTSEDQDEERIITTFQQLCRNEHLQTSKETANLTCYYSTNNSPYLLLQPTKIEDVHLNPWVAIFHDVMRDSVIDRLKENAVPELTRALVGGTNTKGRASEERISKFAWLWEWNNTVVNNLKRRLEAMTGFILIDHSEPLQINNYGIGGYYNTHWDYTTKLPKTSEFHQYFGNRLATLLFYMNDVLAGGATAFPHLKISVAPVKGSAVFWYNLYKSGQGNPKTLHGGCPVLAGVKWVANAWIRQFPQMFRFRCGLNKNDTYIKEKERRLLY